MCGWRLFLGCAILAGVAVLAPAGRAADDGEPVGKVATIPATPGPHWFWLSDVLLHRTALFDADSGRMLGAITAGSVGVGFIISPMTSVERREIYIAESYYSRGIRGDRSDVVTIYDSTTLLPVAEIPIPAKRAEYFPGVHANALSGDGRFVAVFNTAPAQSVSFVDVVERRFTAEVSTPACSLVYPVGPRKFFMLCANGDALVIGLDEAGQAASVVRTEKWFDPEKDPMTEKGVRRGDEWLFSSFEGMVHSIDLSGERPRFGETWSLTSEADRQAGWRVGGSQHLALHRKTGRLFALMHQGPRDTHKDAGGEIWVFDLATHARLQRIPVQNPLTSFVRLQGRLERDSLTQRLLWSSLESVLPNMGAGGMVVTQDDQPRLIVVSQMPPAVTVHDALTGAIVREIAEPGIALGLLALP